MSQVTPYKTKQGLQSSQSADLLTHRLTFLQLCRLGCFFPEAMLNCLADTNEWSLFISKQSLIMEPVALKKRDTQL